MCALKGWTGRRRVWIVVFGLMGVVLLASSWRLMGVVLDNEKCYADMRQIGLWVRLYAADHQGVFPERLSSLHPQYVGKEELEMFVCPASADRAGNPAEIDVWSSYEYVTPPPGAKESTRVMLRERGARHGFSRPRRVFADGATEYAAQ